jgi:hypothetical protein
MSEEQFVMSKYASGLDLYKDKARYYQEQLKPMKTEDWTEDYGDCLFVHFYDMESPPDSNIGSPLETDFDEIYWTHFLPIKWNPLYQFAERN